MRQTRALALVCIAAAICACGDSGATSGETDSSPLEKCAQSGLTNICKCDTGATGNRHCGEDLYWSSCKCAPVMTFEQCKEGDDVVCPSNCKGETEPRTVKCLASGTFDCCPEDRLGTGGGDDASVGDDAGEDDAG